MGLELLMRVFEAGLRFQGVRRRVHELRDGSQLSYFEAGPTKRGPAVVLVHGLGTSNLSWGRVLPRLAQEHRVVAPDLPGYGRSALAADRTHATVTDHARSLGEFLRSDRFDAPVVLVGQSMGGWLSVKTARLAPERIEQLVLVNSAGLLYTGIEELRALVTPRTQEQTLAFWERMWYRVPRYYKPFWKGASAHMHTPNVTRFLDSLKEEDFINDDLPQLGVPVSIVWGRADRFIPPAHVDLLVRALGSTRVHWLARCGHIPALEQPREFARILHRIVDTPVQGRPVPPGRLAALPEGPPPPPAAA